MLDEFDQILVMTVEPGFGGQSFMPETMPKLRLLADEARRRGSSVWLQVDGGIGESTIAQAAEAGADTFVAGSAVFGAADPDAAIAALRATAGRHRPRGDTIDGTSRRRAAWNRHTAPRRARRTRAPPRRPACAP